MKTIKCPHCGWNIRPAKTKRQLSPSQMRKRAGLPCGPSNESVKNLMEELEV